MMRQSAAMNRPSLASTSGLISSDRASTLRAASAHVIRLCSERHATNARASGGPGLNLYDNFAALLFRGEFLGRSNRFISGRGDAATRNFESVGGENGFALIFVKSCHGSLL